MFLLAYGANKTEMTTGKASFALHILSAATPLEPVVDAVLGCTIGYMVMMHASYQIYRDVTFNCIVKSYVLRLMLTSYPTRHTPRRRSNTQYVIRNTQYAIRNTQYAIDSA